jgi:hypothetical protein
MGKGFMHRQTVKNAASWLPISTRLKTGKIKVVTSSPTDDPKEYPCLLLWTGYEIKGEYYIEYDFVYSGEI